MKGGGIKIQDGGNLSVQEKQHTSPRPPLACAREWPRWDCFNIISVLVVSVTRAPLTFLQVWYTIDVRTIKGTPSQHQPRRLQHHITHLKNCHLGKIRAIGRGIHSPAPLLAPLSLPLSFSLHHTQLRGYIWVLHWRGVVGSLMKGLRPSPLSRGLRGRPARSRGQGGSHNHQQSATSYQGAGAPLLLQTTSHAWLDR